MNRNGCRTAESPAYHLRGADAFAAATALSQNAPLVTGDPEFREMSVREPALKIEWIAGA